MAGSVQRHRTAIGRSMLSRPMALAFEDGVLREEVSVLDYGCGRGGDVQRLRQLGLDATGWDPNHRPTTSLAEADVVNLGYVINVIEDPSERREALRKAWSLTRSTLVVAARPAWEARGLRSRTHGDGVLTAKHTFQKFYEQDELRAYIEGTLERRPVAAAPGIFYVFKDDLTAQTVLARRTRRASRTTAKVTDLLYQLHREQLSVLQEFVQVERRLPRPGELSTQHEGELVETFGSLRAAFSLIRRATDYSQWSDIATGLPSKSERRFHEHKSLLEPLVAFVEQRGRLPRLDEIATGSDLAHTFGSIRRAFSIVRGVTGADRWALIEKRARQNFLVYLALAAFAGRPRLSELPEDLQFDVRDLFGTYKKAVGEADRLLYSAGDLKEIDHATKAAPVGKLTREALYVHVSALHDLPPVLRVYEGCGQALAGSVEGATIVKLHTGRPQVSYLRYPTFDSEPHPELAIVVIASFGSLTLTYRDFRDSDNPPILHRKEAFVSPHYPKRAMFARLTEQEERHGLLSSSTIGTRLGWAEALESHGLIVRGHRIVRRQSVIVGKS